MSHHRWDDDPILRPVIAAASADAETEGLLLGGSRGAGVDDAASDYDLTWVLTDQAYDQRVERKAFQFD